MKIEITFIHQPAGHWTAIRDGKTHRVIYPDFLWILGLHHGDEFVGKPQTMGVDTLWYHAMLGDEGLKRYFEREKPEAFFGYVNPTDVRWKRLRMASVG